MKKPLTPKQKKIYDFICNYIDQNGYAPSYYELQNYMRLANIASIHEYITTLVEKGWIKRKPGERRSLRPVRQITKSIDTNIK